MSCIIKANYVTTDNVQEKIRTMKSTNLISVNAAEMAMKTCQRTITSIGFGFFLEINDKIYVITCAHVIGVHTINIKAIVYDKNKIPVEFCLKKFNIIPEYDIAILKLESENVSGILPAIFTEKEINEFNIFKQEKDLNKCKLRTHLETEMIQSEDSKGSNSCFEPIRAIGASTIPVSDVVITLSRLNSVIAPHIPLVEYKISDPHYDSGDNFDGLSGSLMYFKNQPVAMTICYDLRKMVIQAIPVSMISNN